MPAGSQYASELLARLTGLTYLQLAIHRVSFAQHCISQMGLLRELQVTSYLPVRWPEMPELFTALTKLVLISRKPGPVPLQGHIFAMMPALHQLAIGSPGIHVEGSLHEVVNHLQHVAIVNTAVPSGVRFEA